MKKLKILLIEDDKIAQTIAKEVIKKAGSSLDLAESLKKATYLLKINIYDLIFIDLHLNGVSGINIAKKLINELIIDTPVIAITAYNNIRKKHTSFFRAFIEKPFTEQKFKKIITHLKLI